MSIVSQRRPRAIRVAPNVSAPAKPFPAERRNKAILYALLALTVIGLGTVITLAAITTASVLFNGMNEGMLNVHPRAGASWGEVPADVSNDAVLGEPQARATIVDENIQLVQCAAPNGPAPRVGVDCPICGPCGDCGAGWKSSQLIPWQEYGAGEYVGVARTAQVPSYRLRVDDLLHCIFRLTRNETKHPYRLNVGDEVLVESFTDPNINSGRSLIIQPDGTITLRLLGQVKATGMTVAQLREELHNAYLKYVKEPAITVTPIKVNTKLDDLRACVDARYGNGGQGMEARVTPEGTITLPAIGSVPAQGLTLEELKAEIDARYAAEIEGIEVTPVLRERAKRYVYVVGEVRKPGRYELVGPTTLIQAIAMAESYNVGANIRQVVVFRRGEDWQLRATMADLNGALLGRQPCPAGEMWLSDSDIVIVPKSRILQADDFINLVFTRGIYGVFPFSANISWANLVAF